MELKGEFDRRVLRAMIHSMADFLGLPQTRSDWTSLSCYRYFLQPELFQPKLNRFSGAETNTPPTYGRMPDFLIIELTQN